MAVDLTKLKNKFIDALENVTQEEFEQWLLTKTKPMAQQTAVEWFINEIESKGEAWENASIRRVQISIDVSEYLELKRQAKQMEREQIVKAHGLKYFDLTEEVITGEQYYTKTYKE